MKTGNYLAIGVAIAGVIYIFQEMAKKETKEASVHHLKNNLSHATGEQLSVFLPSATFLEVKP